MLIKTHMWINTCILWHNFAWQLLLFKSRSQKSRELRKHAHFVLDYLYTHSLLTLCAFVMLPLSNTIPGKYALVYNGLNKVYENDNTINFHTPYICTSKSWVSIHILPSYKTGACMQS